MALKFVFNPFTGKMDEIPASSGAALSVTTKGDLQTHNGTNPDRLGVGTDGQVLESRASETTGLKWVASPTIPTKATGAEIDTGTDDAKFATAKAIADSKLSYIDGTETLTNKTLTSPKINEDVALTSTATELNLLDGKTSINRSFLYGSSLTNTIAAGETKYVGMGIGANWYDFSLPVPVSGVLKNLTLWTTTSPGSAKTYTATIQINGSDTAITSTYTGTVNNYLRDTTHTANISANDRFSIKFVSGAAAATTSIYYCIEFIPS